MKEYKSRVTVEVMLNVYTTSESEEEAASAAEKMGDRVAKFLGVSLREAFGPSELYMTNYGVRCVDVEECGGE